MNDKLVLGFPKYSQGTGGGAAYPFDDRFIPYPLETPEDLKYVNALVFWGGEDISPMLYNAEPSASAGTLRKNEMGYRDRVEVPLFKQAVSLHIPILGICRGAQLVCALSGGKLVQHVTNHGTSHPILMDNGDVVRTSSVHHQMMYPFEMDKDKYKVIARSVNNRSDVYVMDDTDIRDTIDFEPEIVYFPETKSLAIQGHPEFMRYNDPFVDVCRALVKEYLL